jgi:hypothetical protein
MLVLSGGQATPQCANMSRDGLELTSERWVASDTLDESAEDSTDTNTGTSQTNGSKTSTGSLTSNDNGGSSGFSDDTTGLHGGSDDLGTHLGTSVIGDETVTESWSAGSTKDRALDGS